MNMSCIRNGLNTPFLPCNQLHRTQKSGVNKSFSTQAEGCRAGKTLVNYCTLITYNNNNSSIQSFFLQFVRRKTEE